MKLYKKQFNIYKDYIFILPTITLNLNEPYYLDRSFAIEFHWLVFHARLLWLEGGAK
jgi:hypothetical protein